MCGVRRLGGARRKGSEWWNEEMREAVLVKKRAYERWLQKKDDVTYEYYKGERNRVKRIVKEAKLRADERWGQKMTESFGENKKMFWKEVKRVRKGCSRLEERVKAGDGRLLVKSEDVRGRWAEYFKDLLNVEDGREAVVVAVGRERRMPVLGMLNDGCVVTEEVEGAVAKMKSGKSPGLDGCTVECIKHGGVAVVEWLVRLLNECFRVGAVPLDWVSACVVPLYKGKGDKCECGSFRGISLLSVVGKIYGRILINRVREGTEGVIGEEQGGFRRGRGCVDQVFVVRQVCEKYLAKGKDVFWAFMDLEKAYDRVDREALWSVLGMYGVGGRLLKAVKSLYENSRACVRVGNEVSDWFNVGVGVRQGCVMSPWLFNLYMDGVVREVEARVLGSGLELVGANGQDWILSQLLFADDTALVADSEEKLQRLVTEFGRVCDRRKLRVNVGKSKVLRCTRSRDAGGMNVWLGREKLEEVDAFKYLGSHIARDGCVDVEVKHRVKEARRVMGGMKSVFKCRTLSMGAKSRLYEGVVVPAATYGAESWNMKEEDRRRLDVLEMRCLRDICGVTLWHRLRNEEVRRRAGVPNELSGRVEKGVLRWFGHMERMDNERLTKRVMVSGVRGSRARGRPRLGWMDGVRRGLDARDMTLAQGEIVARNRTEWRAVVERVNGCN